MNRAVAAFLLAIGVAFPAVADEVDEAFMRATKAYERGDYQAAVKDLRFAAERGNGPAQYDLGLIYNLGQGVPKDYGEAIKWYTKAVESGIALAALNLGRMHANGEGVPQDYLQAYKWTSLAAEALSPGRDRDGALKNLDLDAAQLSAEQVAEAKKLTKEWTEKLAPDPN